MASPFSWPVLVPYALRAPAPVNLGVRQHQIPGAVSKRFASVQAALAGAVFHSEGPVQAHRRPGVCSGPALTWLQLCQVAHVQGSIWPSVLRQPAQAPAAPKCHAPSPWLAVRPSAASVGFCAVASHRAGIPQPRLAPSLLGVFRIAG